MKRFAPSSTFPWRLWLLVLLACLAVGFLAGVRAPRPAPFLVLRQPYHMPLPLRDRLTRWIPATPHWAWAWRLQEAVFGKRKPVNLSAEIVSLADSSRPTPSSLALGPASFSHTNGLQVWLLSLDQLKALREHLKQSPGMERLSHPRISTGDGSECGLFVGQSFPLIGLTNQVGLSLDCCARVHADYTDLMACITYSELATNEAVVPGGASLVSIHTNLDTALRLRIPKGNGIFLFDRNARDSGRKTIGVILDPPQPKS